jgi:hypothetical protein
MYNIKKYVDYIFLLVVWIFYSVLNIWFILKDTTPPAWDQSAHLMLVNVYTQLFGAYRFTDMISVSSYYPPFFHLSTTSLFALFGATADVATSVNIIFLGILLFSIYGIGKVLFDRKTGLLAATIISFYPFLINLQRDYLIDFALVSLVSLSVYFLLKSDYFKDIKYSALFGFAFALTILTKWTGVFFLVGPLLYVFYEIYISKKVCAYCGRDAKDIMDGFKHFCSGRHKKLYIEKGYPLFLGKTVNNFLLSSLILIVVAGIWYAPNLKGVYHNVFHFATLPGAQFSHYPSFLTVESLIYYFTAVNQQIYLFFLIIMVIGLFYLIKTRDYKSQKVFLLLSIAIPFVIFTLIKNNNIRYTIPLVIFFALVSAFWVVRIDNKKIRIVIISLILIVGLLQVSTVTFGTPSFDNRFYPHESQPRVEDWRVEDVLDSISLSLPKNPDHRIIVIIIPDRSFVNGRTYEWYRTVRGDQYSVINGVYLWEDQSLDSFANRFRDNVLLVDFLVTNPDSVISEYGYGPRVAAMSDIFEQHRSNFTQVSEFSLPDGSHIVLYRNKRLGE